MPAEDFDSVILGGTAKALEKALELAGEGNSVCLVTPTSGLVSESPILTEGFNDHEAYNEKLKKLTGDIVDNDKITILRNSAYRERREEDGGKRVIDIDSYSVYVDDDKCDGCGDCVSACPVSVLDAGSAGLVDKNPIYHPKSITMDSKFAIDRLRMPYCQASCPIHMDARGYVGSLASGDVKTANEVIADTNPLPLVCGTVCTHPCEETCARGFADTPLLIRGLKRYAVGGSASSGLAEQVKKTEIRNTDGENKIAVIGAGPAGITAARELSGWGYPVTLFDAFKAVGGMLLAGIPNFRLEEGEMRTEVERALPDDVELRLGTTIGDELTLSSLLRDEGFKAVFVAVGAHEGLKLKIEGDDLVGVVSGLEFLRDLNLGKDVTVGKKVVVIGGGNVTVDAARSAVRLGAEQVTILYRRSRAEMPAYDEEVEECEEEGVKLVFLTAPAKIMGGEKGDVVGVECISMELGEPDMSGRRRPMPIEGTEHVVEADMVIAAIGQVIRTEFLECNSELKVGPTNALITNVETCATNVPGVFAGGDAARGPASVIEAIADGKRAAYGIDAFIRGVDIRSAGINAIDNSYYHNAERMPSELTLIKLQKHSNRSYLDPKSGSREVGKSVSPILDGKNTATQSRNGTEVGNKHFGPSAPRHFGPEVGGTSTLLSIEERINNFKQVEQVLTDEQAVLDAKRCFGCRLCIGCGICKAVCPKGAVDYKMQDRSIEVRSTKDHYHYSPPVENAIMPALKELYKNSYNVVTASEFEAMLDPEGAFNGLIMRPYDGEIPRSILFVHMVGEKEGTLGLAQLAGLAGYVRTKFPDIDVKLFTDTKELGALPDEYVHLASSLKDLKDTVVQIPDMAVEEDIEKKTFTVSYTAEEEERIYTVDLIVMASIMKI